MFDLDGTVIDTMSMYRDLASEIISRRVGLNPSYVAKVYMETAGMSFIDQLERMGVKGRVAREIYKEFIERKKRALENAVVCSEARVLAEELSRMGFITAVSTNNECEVVCKIRGLDSFHLILCFDKKKHRKGREHLNTLKMLFGSEARVVFVGDSDYDVKLYSGLGVPVIQTKGLFVPGESRRVLEEILKLFKNP